MVVNKASSEDAEGDKKGSSVGSRRLESELHTVRAEFESIVAEAGGQGSDDGWIERGRDLLEKAEKALEVGKIEQGWSYLHAANRLSIYGLEAVGGEEALHGEARVLLVEAENAPLGWRAEAVRERIANADGAIRETLTSNDLRAAHELLHKGYESIHRKRKHLQSQFRYLRMGGLVAIIAFVLVAIGGVELGLLPTPFFEFQSGSSSGSGPADPAASVWFLVYIALSGIIGATLFGLRSLRQQPAATSTPQYLTGLQAAVARLVVGAGSALAIFFFVRSGLLTIGSETTLTKGPFLIAIAFVAGYSQRLVHTTVESVAEMAESESSDQ